MPQLACVKVVQYVHGLVDDYIQATCEGWQMTRVTGRVATRYFNCANFQASKKRSTFGSQCKPNIRLGAKVKNLGGNVDVERDIEALGETPQSFKRGVMIAGFEMGDRGLLHA
jgi:hypothetical protein